MQASALCVIGHIEDLSFFVPVARDGQTDTFHNGQVLGCAGYTDGDEQLWRNDLAGLVNFNFVRHKIYSSLRPRVPASRPCL